MHNPEEVKRLEDQGLLVLPVLEGPYIGGYGVAKPSSVPGNSRKDWQVFVGPNEIECDGPCVRVYPKNSKWIFQVWESVPGPGPGDFQEIYGSVAEAFISVADYYFGNPSKMNPAELLENDYEESP